MNKQDKILIAKYIKELDYRNLESVVWKNRHNEEGKFMIKLIKISKLIVWLILICLLLMIYKLIF